MLFFVLLIWIGPTASKFPFINYLDHTTDNSVLRTREKLKSGAITVCGDQWPNLLYPGTYDSMDPWNGLLRNNILVRVSD